jgi:hypothetical protein
LLTLAQAASAKVVNIDKSKKLRGTRLGAEVQFTWYS